MKEILARLLAKQHLTEKESYSAFGAILEEKVSPIQTAAFLALLRAKGENSEEISGAAKLLRDKALKIRISSPVVVDTCGTGGDASGSFNVSTAAAIVASGCGLKVAKHGNRAISSLCGSADVLEALGYPLEASPEKIAKALSKFGFAFLFAPFFHRAMKSVAPVRKDLGFRTIFNLIGPLCNPAGANVQIMGVGDPALLETISQVFQKLGIRGYVFWGEDGLDEITLTGRTFMVEVKGNRLRKLEVFPETFGLKRCRKEELKGGTPEENAEIIKGVASGKIHGAYRNIVAINVATLLKACGKVKNFREGVALVNQVLDKGIPWAIFQSVTEFLRC
ncbi:MAG: anthranilate phosphoribosyltransferase, partial [Candidatus Omnitrophica bacterium]|nr:anthranilate phosphoribosyltransferase [Candidatus Omnitrophota bacterium]